MIENYTEKKCDVCVPDEIDWHIERKIGIVDSYEELCEDEEHIPDELIDYNSCETILGDIMVYDFMNTLNNKEKYIIESLLNGMTHQEISDTMDCTRQSVDRLIERIGAKAVDFLSYK